jgi:predicted alpha-1,2-mannosidase
VRPTRINAKSEQALSKPILFLYSVDLMATSVLRRLPVSSRHPRWFRSIGSLLLSALLWLAWSSSSFAEPVDWMNLYIGTGDGTIGYGGTMPFVTTPFGMTNWTAQTREIRRPGTSYNYADTNISGFIGTHQPATWMGDYGYVTLMPEFGDIKVTAEQRKLAFARSDEVATPYYYSVVMKAAGSQTVKTEMTATDHCALMRFTFSTSEAPSVLVEATRKGTKGYVSVNAGAREISGYNPDRMDARFGPFSLPNFKGYFVVQFRQAFARYGTYRGENVSPNVADVSGENVGAYVTFDSQATQEIEVRVGTSFVSVEQARKNISLEVADWDLRRLSAALKAKWNAKLGIVSIDGASDDQRRIFYTALYHALLYPKLFSEHGRYHSAFDDSIHSGTSYTAFSIWDTFRAEHSLLSIIAPERVDAMIGALLQDYQEGGWMPKWPNPSYTNIMIGTHADSLVAEAMGKGFHGFDRQLAYRAVYKDAMVPPDEDTTRRWLDEEPHTPYEARGGLTYSKKLGYIPADKTSESASSTIEEAYDDWCVAQVAKALGKMEDYKYFLARSLNYKKLYNPATGFMQAKNSDGSWASPEEGWTEGDKWAYTWAALHDIPGLMALMGGPDSFNEKLDAYFAGGHNKHDNEPSHHYPYLYDYSGQPWKTQAKVREIANTLYANRPDGLAGDDDCGQMSAWYVFAAMGFYPVNPASGEYMIGSPLFKRITLNLPNGNRFAISATNQSERNGYIQSVRLNGTPLTVPVIRYSDIERGGTLSFTMGPAPSRWAADWKPVPLAP